MDKAYHLRWNAPGTGFAIPLADYPNGRIVLIDMTNSSPAEDHEDHDTDYDDMLIARISPENNSIIPVMTATTTAGVTITSSSNYSGYVAWGAGDTDATTAWLSGGSADAWLKVEFPAAKTVSEFSIQPRLVDPDHRPTEFHLEGSNDDATWDNLTGTINFATWNLETNAAENFEVPVGNRAAYTYYRLTVTDTDSNSFTSIGDFALFENTGTEVLPLKNAVHMVGEVEKSTFQISTNTGGETGPFSAIAHPINWARKPFATFAEQRVGAATGYLEEAIVNTFLDVNRYNVKPLVIGIYTSSTNVGGIINGRYRVPLTV